MATDAHASDRERGTIIPDPGPSEMTAADLGKDRLGRFGRYWLSLIPDGGGIPARESFDPASINSMLPNLIVVEHVGGDDFLYRLLGTGIDWFTKRNYTGLRTSEIEGHGSGNRIHALYMATIESNSMVGVTLPYVGAHTICQSVRQIAVPFRLADGRCQIISLIEFDLVVGVNPGLLPPEKREVI